jgi:hypothetical protein
MKTLSLQFILQIFVLGASVHHEIGRLRNFWLKIEVVNRRGQEAAFPPSHRCVSSQAKMMGILKSFEGSFTTQR